MTGTDEHNITNATSDQLQPAKDEGLQKDVAEFAVGLYKRQQCFTFDFDHLTWYRRTDAHQTSSSGKRGQFAREHAWATDSDDLFPIVSDTQDFQLAFDDNEELSELLIEFNQGFVCVDFSDATVRQNTCLLCNGERWKYFVRS